MKSVKLTKVIQMILINIIAIVTGIILVAIISNNKVNAASSKPICPICITSENMQFIRATDAKHTYVCSVHGQMVEQLHKVEEWEHDEENEAGEHSGICKVCEKQATEKCNWQDATCTEPKTCEDCEQTTGKPLGHNYQNWTSAGESQHKGTCSRCKDTTTVGCEWQDATCTEQKKCKVCKQTTGEPLGHNYIWTNPQQGKHKGICNKCDATTSGECTEGNHENGGTCQICGDKYQSHGISTIISKYEKNKQQHRPIYKCLYIECTETYIGTAEEHIVKEWKDNEDETHSGNCLTCDYKVTLEHEYKNGKCSECGVAEPIDECEHTYRIKRDTEKHWYVCTKCDTTQLVEAHKYEEFKDNGDGTHSRICEVCKYDLKEDHNYTDGKCTDCEAIEECTHEYEMKNDENNHWEECSKCNDKKTAEAHKMGITADNGDGTHSSICKTCEYELKVAHNYKNGKCSECGVAKPIDECEHTYRIKRDAKKHWYVCTKCDATQLVEAHKYEEFKDNGDGTHSSICKTCEYELKVAHNYKNGKCSECGVVQLNNNNNDSTNNNNNDINSNQNITINNNNSGNANKDNTTINSEIPKAGLQNNIFTIITVLGVVLVITIFKMKKYKSI